MRVQNPALLSSFGKVLHLHSAWHLVGTSKCLLNEKNALNISKLTYQKGIRITYTLQDYHEH